MSHSTSPKTNPNLGSEQTSSPQVSTPTTKEQIESFNKLNIARKDYYWGYTPHPVLVKDKDQPRYLGDSTIKKHIKGEEVIGLSPFVDNENVLYGGIDIDVHGPTPLVIENKEKEIGKEATSKWVQEQIDIAQKHADGDVPLICEELDKLGYSYLVNSSGSSGRHIRIYGPEPTNAKVMRYFIKDLQKRILGEERHETFPKQDCLSEDTPYGNQMKAILAIHPKTKGLAGIIVNHEVQDKETSLLLMHEFYSKLKNAKQIEFEITPEIEEEIKRTNNAKKIDIKDVQTINEFDVPNYCGTLEILSKKFIPSNKHTKHEYIDSNAAHYMKDKPDKLQSYCEVQGRNYTAFNGHDKRKFLCAGIRKFINNSDHPVASECKSACASCPLFNKGKIDLKPIIECKDQDNKISIVKDVIKSNLDLDPLDQEEMIEKISVISGLNEETIIDQIKHSKKQREESEKAKKKKVVDIKSKISIGSNLYVNNDDKGIHLCKFNQDKYETQKVVHGFQIKSIKRLKNKYISDFLYDFEISNQVDQLNFSGNVDDFVNYMKSLPGCISAVNIKDCVNAIVNHKEINKQIPVVNNPLMNAFGYYYDGDKIIGKDLDKTKLLKNDKVNKETLKDGLRKLFDFVELYAKNEEHKKKIIQIISIMLVYPFGYSRKQNGRIAPCLFVSGSSGTGKTLLCMVQNCIFGILNLSGVEVTGTSVKSPYQVAKKCNEHTFGVFPQEAKSIFDLIEQGGGMSELFKNNIESPGLIYSNNAGKFIGYSNTLCTANYPFNPTSNALKIKIISFHFGEDCKHTGDERSKGVDFIRDYEDELLKVGQYINLKVLANDEKYYSAIMEKDYSKAGMMLLKNLVDESGLNVELPEPAKIGCYENIESNTFWDDLLDYIRQDLFQRARTVSGKTDSFTLGLDEALQKIIISANTPAWLVYQERKERILISANVIAGLQSRSKIIYDSGVFERECVKLGLEYVKSFPLKKNGKSLMRNGLLIGKNEFFKLFDACEEEIVEEKIE